MSNSRNQRPERRIELGQYIVADPKVCHGKVTFKGTRIFVSDVLDDVENGLSWDFIIRRWGGGKLTRAAIAEALHLSRSMWLDDRGHLLRRSAGSRLPEAA
jgi:uncharacterized protein (DUF433 family)